MGTCSCAMAVAMAASVNDRIDACDTFLCMDAPLPSKARMMLRSQR